MSVVLRMRSLLLTLALTTKQHVNVECCAGGWWGLRATMNGNVQTQQAKKDTLHVRAIEYYT